MTTPAIFFCMAGFLVLAFIGFTIWGKVDALLDELCRNRTKLRDDVYQIHNCVHETQRSLKERLKRSPGAMPLATGEQMAAAHEEAAPQPTPRKGIRKGKR